MLQTSQASHTIVHLKGVIFLPAIFELAVSYLKNPSHWLEGKKRT